MHPVKACTHCEANTTQGLFKLPPLVFQESISPTREQAVCVIRRTIPRKRIGRSLDRESESMPQGSVPIWWCSMMTRCHTGRWAISSGRAWVAEHYRQTLYLDCDVIVRRDAPNVFELVPETHWGVVDELPTVIASGNGDGFLSNLAAVAAVMRKQKPIKYRTVASSLFQE